MIECCKENIYYKKRNKNKRKKIFAVFLSVLFISSFFIYYRYVVSQNVLNISSDYGYSYCVESVNQSVLLSLENDADYSSVVKIEKNSSGEISMISFDSYKVNYLSRKIVTNVEILLKEKLKKGIPIPLFAFSGIKLLSGLGPEIYFKALSVNSVDCEFKNKFLSSGINQTLHSIYVNVKCLIKFEFPLAAKTIECFSEILVAEAVIVGKVPEIYLNNSIK